MRNLKVILFVSAILLTLCSCSKDDVMNQIEEEVIDNTDNTDNTDNDDDTNFVATDTRRLAISHLQNISNKENQFIILTEKEIQLIELFLNTKKPISKDNILSSVWNYSSDADTHTVETHIYRLRKKISDKFMDEKFILNNKDGYYF